MSKQLRDKITNVKEFNVIEETLGRETKKRKNLTAAGIDGIQNFWWKSLKPARSRLKRAFEQVKDNNDEIPVWWQKRKTKYLTDEKNYRPITFEHIIQASNKFSW